MLPKGSVGAEIGVWRGDFSAAILESVRPRRLHLIDPWQSTGHVWLHDQSTLNQDYVDGVHAAVMRRFRSEIENGTVIVHRTTSQQVAPVLPDGYLDWAYIDGDHRYEAVLADLRAYAAKVRPGGYLCGDDYATRSNVKRAVDEFAVSGECSVVTIRSRQFVLQRREGLHSAR